jgi:hypothetical protein
VLELSQPARDFEDQVSPSYDAVCRTLARHVAGGRGLSRQDAVRPGVTRSKEKPRIATIIGLVLAVPGRHVQGVRRELQCVSVTIALPIRPQSSFPSPQVPHP